MAIELALCHLPDLVFVGHFFQPHGFLLVLEVTNMNF